MSAEVPGQPIDAAARLQTARLSGTRLSAALYEALKERLLEGEYAAGEKIVVGTLLQEFGVSKQPIMEALRRLSSDKLVHIIPQVGCEVAHYGADETDDFFLLFASVEGMIASIAALRRTSGQLDRLRHITDAADRLVKTADPRQRAHEYRVTNREFHATVHHMSHSRVMADTSQRMWDMSDFLINTTGAEDPLAGALVERQHDHHCILDAIADGDAKAARLAMEEHITGTVQIIRRADAHPA